MVMGWTDTFHYGMFQGCRVDAVWITKPSYLVWTVIYTNHSFVEPIMDKLREHVDRGIRGGITPTLHREFLDRFMGGPW